MTYPNRQYQRPTIAPGLEVSESDQKRAQLAAFGKTPDGPAALKTVAAHFGIAGGRKWGDLTMREVDQLWRHTVGGVPLPAPVDESEVWTADESPEGMELNSRIPF